MRAGSLLECQALSERLLLLAELLKFSNSDCIMS